VPNPKISVKLANFKVKHDFIFEKIAASSSNFHRCSSKMENGLCKIWQGSIRNIGAS
jgi:hypothetical protein